MIKPIIESELEECLEIMKAGFEAAAIRFGQTEENCPHRGRTRLPLSELRNEFLEGCQMYGYFYDNKQVGFLSLLPLGDAMRVNDLVLLPEYQKKGFGSELMQFTKDEAGKQKCEKIKLGMIDDNVELKRWYENHGFKTVELFTFDTVTYKVGRMELVL